MLLVKLKIKLIVIEEITNMINKTLYIMFIMKLIIQSCQIIRRIIIFNFTTVSTYCKTKFYKENNNFVNSSLISSVYQLLFKFNDRC